MRAAAEDNAGEEWEAVEGASPEDIVGWMDAVGSVWEEKRSKIAQRQAQDGKRGRDARKREQEAGEAEEHKMQAAAERMMRRCGKDGIKIVSERWFAPAWLAKGLKKLAVPLREAVRVFTILAVCGSFGYGVEVANRKLKGPRRTTPPPVRTTTGLPY